MNSIERDVDACFAAVDKVFPQSITLSPAEIVAISEEMDRDSYRDEREEYNPYQEYVDNGVSPKDFA